MTLASTQYQQCQTNFSTNPQPYLTFKDEDPRTLTLDHLSSSRPSVALSKSQKSVSARSRQSLGRLSGRSHRTSTTLKYTVNYSQSLAQMSTNLGVYGALTELKLRERAELEEEIRVNKLASKALKKESLACLREEQDCRREVEKMAKVTERKREERMLMERESQEIRELLP